MVPGGDEGIAPVEVQLGVVRRQRDRPSVIFDGADHVSVAHARNGPVVVGSRRIGSLAHGRAERLDGGQVLAVVVERDAPVHRSTRGRAGGGCDGNGGNGDDDLDCPIHGHAPPSRLRSISSAIWADCFFTELRSPPKRNRRDTTSPATATPMNTVPTGLAALPPSGPAMPVMERPHGLPERSQIPRAIASAQAALTAPCALNTSSGTPSSSCLARLEYTTTPRSKYADEPAMFVRRWPTRPPVHDS